MCSDHPGRFQSNEISHVWASRIFDPDVEFSDDDSTL